MRNCRDLKQYFPPLAVVVVGLIWIGPSPAEDLPASPPETEDSALPEQQDDTDQAGVDAVPGEDAGSHTERPASPVTGPRDPAKGVIVIFAAGEAYLGPPVLEVRVNGKLLQTITVTNSQIEDFILELPPDLMPVRELSLRYANDRYDGEGKDRNLVIGRILIGDQEFAPESARYLRDDHPAIPGQRDMQWQGALVFTFQ